MTIFHLLTILATALTISSSPLDKPGALADDVVVRAKPSPRVFKWCKSNSCHVWGHSPAFVDMQIPSSLVQSVPESVEIMEHSVSKLVASQRQQVSQLRREFKQALESDTPSTANDLYFDNYHTYDEIVKWSNGLAERFPDVVKVEQFGHTLEKRTLTMLRITGAGDVASKKRIVIHANMHAKEWIAGATAQYLAEQLAKGYADKNARIVQLLDKLEFLIVPIANPDGYAYTWTEGNRLWRKNMRRFENGTLYGVDLNRNWPNGNSWCIGEFSSIDNPNDDTFCGEKPLSEPEVASMVEYFGKTTNIIGALDFHCYTELLLRPFGYTETPAPLAIELPMARVSEEMKNAIMAVNATSNYTTIRAVDLYLASGADDWWNGEAVKPGQDRIYGMTVELSPAATPWQGGFILPPTRIRGVGEEMTQGVLKYAEFILANPLPKKGSR